MKIGIIVAMDKELQQLQQVFSADEVCVRKSGIGKVNAALGAQRLIDEMHPDAVISTGCAGGNGDDVSINDIVVSTELAYHDVYCGKAIDDTTVYGQVQGLPARFQADPLLLRKALEMNTVGADPVSARKETALVCPRIHGGLIVTGDWFVDSREKMRHIVSLFPEAKAVDMESAAIAQTCFLNKVPFISFRVISDVPLRDTDASQYHDFWATIAENSFRTTRRFIDSLRSMAMTLVVLLGCLVFHAPEAVAQKRIYIPEDLRAMNLDSDTSRWCWKRSAETRDVIFMWERGFGNDLQAPPALDGKPMAFNLPVLMERVQTFYTFFRDTLGFSNLNAQPSNLNSQISTLKPQIKSKADIYKMMVMVNYSLEGTAYGGTYDNFIGALWVAPNRIQDKTMNCMAHELGHSFQSQIMADSIGDCWGGTGFFEMASQWMLWQVNPWWLRDENYHFEAFKKLTHKAFLDMENIYHSPYVLQWWSDQRGRHCIAELFRQGRIGEDPVLTYQRLYGLTQQQFCDELFLGYQHLVNFDFKHAWNETRPYAATWQTPIDTLRGGWLQPQTTLEDYGFHIIPLPDGHRGSVKVQGKNLKWTVVGIDADGHTVYDAQRVRTPMKKRFLLVMAAPTTHQALARHFGPDAGSQDGKRLYPYRFHL